MANCMGMNCAHMDEKSGKCTFSGVCIVKQYKLNDTTTLDSVLNVKPENVVESVQDKVAFNPFQRGNGCMLAGYTYDEIWAHTR